MAHEESEQRNPHRMIGERLEGARLQAGLTLRQVGELTRISPEVLQRIEAGKFGECGGDVYARGHIRVYAQAVGLDPEPLLAQYGAFKLPPLTRRDLRRPRIAAPSATETAEAAPRAPQKPTPHRARSVLPTIVPGAVPSLVPMAGAGAPPELPPLKHRRREDFTDADAGSATALIAGPEGPAPVNERPAAFLAGARTSAKAGANWSLALIGALAAIGLVAAVQLWPTGSAGGGAHAGTTSTHHRTKPAQPQVAPGDQSASAGQPQPAAASASTAARTVDVRLVAGNSPSWVGVTNSAGHQLYWSVLKPGQSREFSDASKLDVVVSNPAAVDLVVNGHDLGAQGTQGQIFHGSYTPDSVH